MKVLRRIRGKQSLSRLIDRDAVSIAIFCISIDRTAGVIEERAHSSGTHCDAAASVRDNAAAVPYSGSSPKHVSPFPIKRRKIAFQHKSITSWDAWGGGG